MARFFIRLLLFLGVVLGVLYALQRHAPGPPMPPVLELPAHTVRIAVEGRPVDLPLYSLHALFSPTSSSDQITLDIHVVESPGERWRMLAAGEVDLVVSTLDEFALAVPRFSPGQILFPVAQSVGSDAVVSPAKLPPGDLRVAYVSGSPGESLTSKLAAMPDHTRAVVPIPAPDAQTARSWYEHGQVGALATCEPYLTDYLAQGDQTLIRTSPSAPITQVWVASRQALHNERQPRVSRQDLEQVAQAWFLLMGRLQVKPGLALGAIARDNDLQVAEVQKAFQGLDFLSLSQARALTAPQLLAELDELATDWSLSAAFNAIKPGSFEQELDLALLAALRASDGTAETPTPEEAPSPAPEASAVASPSPEALPLPSLSPGPDLESPDPFSVPVPESSP